MLLRGVFIFFMFFTVKSEFEISVVGFLGEVSMART